MAIGRQDIQHSLFDDRREVVKRERQAQLRENVLKYIHDIPVHPFEDTVLVHARVMVEFTFSWAVSREAVDEFVDRPLFCLGGMSLRGLIERGHQKIVKGWIDEVRMARHEPAELKRLSARAAVAYGSKK